MKKKILILLAVVLFNCFFAGSIYAQEANNSPDLTQRMSVLVFQLSIILFTAWFGGAVFNKLRIPSVLGELFAGIIIGPYLLGALSVPGFPAGLFPLSEGFPISNELYSFTAVASIVLLFLTGLETNIETFLRYSFVGSIVGIFGVLASFIAGDFIGVVLSDRLFHIQYSFLDPVPLFLGIISTATSVGITARILSDKKKMDSPEGVTIISAAVIDDILGIICLAIVIGIVKSGHVEWVQIGKIGIRAIAIWLGFTVVGLGFAHYISSFLKKFKDATTIAIMSLSIALLLSGIFEKSGLAMIIGAYVMGLSLSKTDISFMIQEKLSIIHRFFVPIFFCVMGMLVNFKEMVSLPILTFGLIYFVFAVLGKIVGCGIPPLFLNFNLRGAARIGVGMVPRGEVALIIAGIGLTSGIIPHNIFSVSVIMTFFTTFITPLILAKMLSVNLPVLRKDQELKQERKEIKYAMPNPETAELLLSKVISAFQNEGFYVHLMGVSNKLYQIRKKEIAVTMQATDQELMFDCLEKDAAFINTLFYEVLAELEYLAKHLKTFTGKEKVVKEIFSHENGYKNGTKKDKFTVTEIFPYAAVEVDLRGTNKKEILMELVDLLVRSGQLEISKSEHILAELLEREEIMSTGMQEGVAFPHTKTSLVNNLKCAIGLKKQGIDFNSLDGKPSTIFVLILSPKEHPKPYLQLLAEVSSFLMDAGNLQRILQSRDSSELYDILISIPR